MHSFPEEKCSRSRKTEDKTFTMLCCGPCGQSGSKWLVPLPTELWDTMTEDQKSMYRAHTRVCKNGQPVAQLNNQQRPHPQQYRWNKLTSVDPYQKSSPSPGNSNTSESSASEDKDTDQGCSMQDHVPQDIQGRANAYVSTGGARTMLESLSTNLWSSWSSARCIWWNCSCPGVSNLLPWSQEMQHRTLQKIWMDWHGLFRIKEKIKTLER